MVKVVDKKKKTNTMRTDLIFKEKYTFYII